MDLGQGVCEGRTLVISSCMHTAALAGCINGKEARSYTAGASELEAPHTRHHVPGMHMQTNPGVTVVVIRAATDPNSAGG